MTDAPTLAGRRAFVAASSGGIGYACAAALAAAGCSVTINGRDPERLQLAARRLRRDTGGSVYHAVLDVTQDDAADRLAAGAEPFDILVTNAEGPPPSVSGALDPDAFRASFNVNTVAMVALIAAALPGMRQRGFGRIVNILSVAAVRPVLGLDASAASRAGLVAGLRGPAREAARHGVTINGILPGPILTERTARYVAARAAAGGRPADAVGADLLATIPADRFGTPEEVGALCAYLCSPLAGFVTGQNICIDGGISI